MRFLLLSGAWSNREMDWAARATICAAAKDPCCPFALDYGCGRGDDARIMGIHSYDPHYNPDERMLERKWSAITCNYVLNVVDETTATSIIEKIRSMLIDDGVAYISVRRDIKKEGLTSKGTFQRNVVLDLPVLYEKKKSFAIYKLTR